MKEAGIAEHCIQRLKDLADFKVDIGKEQFAQLRPDFFIDLEVLGHALKCAVEVKTNLTEQKLWFYRNQLHDYHAKDQNETCRILFTDYVRPRLAEEMRKFSINYVDTAGNIYLRHPDGLYIFIKGNRPLEYAERKRGSLTQAAGLKVLYVLLLHPEAANWTVRRLAHDAGVGLATVKRTTDELAADGFIQKVAKGKKQLTRKRELLERWVVGYADVLRPKLFKRRFRAQETNLVKLVKKAGPVFKRQGIPYAITGGYAADLLVHHYLGNELTIFVDDWNMKAEEALGWLPDKNGLITLLDMFGEQVAQETKGEVPVTPPLVTYAELLATGGERARETANIIYRNHIEGIVIEP